nr:hypothetical protein [Tanacetum cinerariifolium]
MVALVFNINCGGDVGGGRLVEMKVMRCGYCGGCGVAVMVKMGGGDEMEVVVSKMAMTVPCGDGGDAMRLWWWLLCGGEGKDGVWRTSAVGGRGEDGDGVGLEMMMMMVGGWWPKSGRKW